MNKSQWQTVPSLKMRGRRGEAADGVAAHTLLFSTTSSALLQVIFAAALILVLTTALSAADFTESLKPGKADIKFAGPLAFGPDGVLFVGDSLGSAVYAIDTGDRIPVDNPAEIDLKDIDGKVAALLGVSPNQLLLNDMAVNPISKNVYLSMSRGRSPTSESALIRIDRNGKFSTLPLDNVKFSKTVLNDARSVRYRGGWRMEAITDIAVVGDTILVAGLSNEEFSSNLRTIPFPFADQADKGTGVEIYHGSHGRWETNAPVRTFVPYVSNGTPYILAAYTCTPLVKLPMSALKSGSKATGTTIADFGGGNRPLDMVIYKKDGHDFVLMSNSARGVMRLEVDGLDSYESISSQTDNFETDVPYDVLDLRNVEQLSGFDDTHALILQQSRNGSLELKTIVLP
jgi:hypothetical protein